MLLGTAAGGGVPQWNCWCAVCRAARETPPRVARRTESALAVSADGRRWFLCNASPAVREQIARLEPMAAPPDVVRWSPVEGVLFTDAELDHTLGLVLLREAGAGGEPGAASEPGTARTVGPGRGTRAAEAQGGADPRAREPGRLTVYATSAVLQILERRSRLLRLTRAFSPVSTAPLTPDVPCALRYADGTESGLTAEAVVVRGHAPRFAPDTTASHTVGLLLRDRATGGCAAYIPSCGALDDELRARLAEAALVFFDGTCWHDDDMARAGAGTRTGRAMGHMPIASPHGSLRALTADGHRVVYTHLNNTNPVLLDGSPERCALERAGARVGTDGMSFDL